MSINLANVSKYFDNQVVVNDITLEIETGELFVLLGASGSGKSTLLRMIAGLTETDNGTIALNGRDVTHLRPQERGIGFVFQNYSLFQHMTVAENIAFGLDVQRVPKKEQQKRVEEMLELIDLAEYNKRKPFQLSGGQQQRVAVARALAPKPDVLLLDEPFGALDVNIRTQLRRNLREIQKTLGVTAILVTHDQEEAFELADRIGVIEAGQLLEVGTPAALYRRPQQRFTAQFLGQANLLRANRNGKYVHIHDLELPAPNHTEHLAGQPVDLMLRPESIKVVPLHYPVENCLGRAIVEQVEFVGTQERVTLRLDSGETIQALLSPIEIDKYNIEPESVVLVGVRDYHLLPVEQ
jgi:sulfate/thiosulfate transport system ATP-binding protein